MQGYHLALFQINQSGAGTDVDAPAIPDGILTVQNNHFILRNPMLLLGAWAEGLTLTRAKLASPTLRQTVNPYIRAPIGAVLPGGNPNVWQLDFSPFQLAAFEEIQALISDTTGTTDRVTVGLILADSVQPNPLGNIFPCRWTSTTAAVSNTWTPIVPTFEQTLPPGVYNMFASEHFSTNAIAHAWSIPNQVYRPGMPSSALNTNRLPYQWMRGALGSMGQFRSNALPTPLVFCNGTDASHEGYLWVQKVGSL